MTFFLQAQNVSSPPSSPPPYRRLQRQRSSYLVDNNSNAGTIKDKVRLDYMYKVKNTFQHLSFQQRYTFLTEILECCDNELLQYIYTFITPKLKIDFLKELPIELSLYIVSCIQDPVTLAKASRVSRHWHQLTKDENIWKALCLKYQYNNNSSLNQLSIHSSYRDLFRRKYNIDTAWNLGGKIIYCGNQIGEGLATSLQMDDTYIVIGCDNNNIEVYDAKNGKYIRSLIGHEGGVWAIQFIKNEENEHILVTGGCDRGARVWNLTTGELLFVLRGHVSTVRCLKVRDDKIAITGSRDATIRIWDIKRGEIKHVCVGHQSSVRCLEIYDNQFVSGSYDSTARLWDIETGQCIHEFIGHHSQIYAIAFDGKKIVTGSLDSNIRIWSAQTGNCLITLQGHTSLVGHLQLFDHILVSGGSDGCLRVWDMNTFECKHRISAHDNSVTCIQVDNKRILSGGSDGKVKLWDIDSGTLIRSFTDTARTVWKIQLNDTKAVVILQRQTNTINSYHAVIELHDFDTYSPNFL